MLGKRARSLDCLRGLAVLFMFTWHFLSWLSGIKPVNLPPLTLLNLIPVIFLFTAGVATSISVLARLERDMPVKNLTFHVIKRRGVNSSGSYS